MLTLAALHTFEEEIKKSRFIARAGPVSTPEDTFAFLEAVKDPQATHNCWVFKIGGNYRFSEDGEPKGTAGKPILNAIERKGLDHVMVVVTRYFGGIKLGAGGLTRAYGGVASQCLEEAEKKEVVPMITARIEAGFDIIGPIYTIMKQFDSEKLSEKFTDRGIEIEVRLEASRAPDMETALTNMSRGTIRWTCLDEED